MLGGNFGIWGGLFSSFDCAVKGYRQKEDPWNAIISGFLTGGTLALRGESCLPVGWHTSVSDYSTPRTTRAQLGSEHSWVRIMTRHGQVCQGPG